MIEFKMLVEIAGIVGLTIVLIQCIKLKLRIPGPIYPILALAIAIPLNVLNVYLANNLPPWVLFAVQGAVVAVLVAFGVVSSGQKMFEKSPETGKLPEDKPQ